jgi:hypothetical protein
MGFDYTAIVSRAFRDLVIPICLGVVTGVITFFCVETSGRGRRDIDQVSLSVRDSECCKLTRNGRYEHRCRCSCRLCDCPTNRLGDTVGEVKK